MFAQSPQSDFARTSVCALFSTSNTVPRTLARKGLEQLPSKETNDDPGDYGSFASASEIGSGKLQFGLWSRQFLLRTDRQHREQLGIAVDLRRFSAGSVPVGHFFVTLADMPLP
jgi:hypothetical protein